MTLSSSKISADRVPPLVAIAIPNPGMAIFFCGRVRRRSEWFGDVRKKLPQKFGRFLSGMTGVDGPGALHVLENE